MLWLMVQAGFGKSSERKETQSDRRQSTCQRILVELPKLSQSIR